MFSVAKSVLRCSQRLLPHRGCALGWAAMAKLHHAQTLDVALHTEAVERETSGGGCTYWGKHIKNDEPVDLGVVKLLVA